MKIEALIAGRPQPKERPRHNAGRVYTPAKTRNWETAAALQLKSATNVRGYAAPVGVRIIAVWSRPKRRPSSIDPAEWNDGGRIWRTATPDLDNVEKCCNDAIQLAGILQDDRFVCLIESTKLYGAIGETDHVQIQIFDL